MALQRRPLLNRQVIWPRRSVSVQVAELLYQRERVTFILGAVFGAAAVGFGWIVAALTGVLCG